jgi:CspA family cold shock protein
MEARPNLYSSTPSIQEYRTVSADPLHCAPATPGLRGRRVLAVSQRTGIVGSWFNGEGGYGFIHPEDGGEAVFVHHTSIAAYAKAKSLKKGARVTYEVARRKMGGLWAKDVCRAD